MKNLIELHSQAQEIQTNYYYKTSNARFAEQAPCVLSLAQEMRVCFEPKDDGTVRVTWGLALWRVEGKKEQRLLGDIYQILNRKVYDPRTVWQGSHLDFVIRLALGVSLYSEAEYARNTGFYLSPEKARLVWAACRKANFILSASV